MNSKQRRKDRREWCYSVNTAPIDDHRNWHHYLNIWDWCDSQWGRDIDKCGWRESSYNRSVWEFNCPKKAAYFALKWAN